MSRIVPFDRDGVCDECGVVKKDLMNLKKMSIFANRAL